MNKTIAKSTSKHQKMPKQQTRTAKCRGSTELTNLIRSWSNPSFFLIIATTVVLCSAMVCLVLVSPMLARSVYWTISVVTVVLLAFAYLKIEKNVKVVTKQKTGTIDERSEGSAAFIFKFLALILYFMTISTAIQVGSQVVLQLGGGIVEWQKQRDEVSVHISKLESARAELASIEESLADDIFWFDISIIENDADYSQLKPELRKRTVNLRNRISKVEESLAGILVASTKQQLIEQIVYLRGAIAFFERDYENAKEFFERVEGDSIHAARSKIKQLQIALKGKDYKSAEVLTSELERGYPNDRCLQFWQGHLYEKTGDLAAASTAYALARTGDVVIEKRWPCRWATNSCHP